MFETHLKSLPSPSAASSTTGPEPQVPEREGPLGAGRSPASWSILEVMQFVREADPAALGPHAELFRKHVSLKEGVCVLEFNVVLYVWLF